MHLYDAALISLLCHLRDQLPLLMKLYGELARQVVALAWLFVDWH